MASLNVAEWSPDQVAEWMSGLEASVARYAGLLRARELAGARLLTLRCDDLEYLGVLAIGHQELLLEAVDHLRNFHYEMRRECVQQLAVRVSAAGAGLARALRGAGGGVAVVGAGAGGALETQALADVARLVSCVKPLVCWLDRWPLCSSPALAERRAALLKLSLEAATCAQRERFAEQPARAVAASAAAAAATADYIIQDVADPTILAPASLEAVCVRQGDKPLGFALRPASGGHHTLKHIRFGSPAHASGHVHDGDEIVQVGEQCVVGWSGEAVEALCRAVAARTGDLPLRLRRRGARPPPPAPRAPRPHAALLPAPPPPPAPAPPHAPPREDEDVRAGAGAGADSSDESEALSPPASPTQLHLDHTRMYPPKPRAAPQRRHTVSCGSPIAKRPNVSIEQFWRELKEQQCLRGGSARLSASPLPGDDTALYRRDKAVSCSTGLELSPRPRTCLGVALPAPPAPAPQHTTPAHAAPPSPSPAPSPAPAPPPSPGDRRGKLDKSHSTPAYDLDGSADSGGVLAAQPIPESPTTPVESPTVLTLAHSASERLQDLKRSTNQLNEALQRTAVKDFPASPALEALNTALLEYVDADPDTQVDTPPPRLVAAVNPFFSPPLPRQPARSATPPSPPPRPAPAPAPAPRASLSSPPPPPAPGSANTSLSPGAHSPVPLTPAREFPALRIVPRQPETPDKKEFSPLKPLRNTGSESPSISLPLRHLSKHDIRAVPGSGRALPALNSPPSPPPPALAGTNHHANHHANSTPTQPVHTSSGRGIFPSSKTRSLKKKNSLLAKRRAVSWRAVSARGVTGAVFQRVRARHAAGSRWARRHLLLAHDTLYAFRSIQSLRADCMIALPGWAVCAAGEVRSRQHAFKVYHTGTAFYFAADSRDAMQAWLQLLTRATQATTDHQVDVSNHFSETDYSETESDSENPDRRGDRERAVRDREREKEKDKGKFGSLKKLTSRMARSESHEAVAGGGAAAGGGGHTAASLDRKCLRFFSRHRGKEEHKHKSKTLVGVPVPTEHVRTYRRVLEPSGAGAEPGLCGAGVEPRVERTGSKKLLLSRPHASNPNLAEGSNSEWHRRGAGGGAGGGRRLQSDFLGSMTLEEFMLQKQEEERKQVYTNRVLMGVERTAASANNASSQVARAKHKELQKQLEKIIPDVIYGELPDSAPPVPPAPARALPPAPESPLAPPPAPRTPRTPHMGPKPISVKGKDGYEKIVYPEELPGAGGVVPLPLSTSPPAPAPAPPTPERWRDSLRRNDKVHSGHSESSPPPRPRLVTHHPPSPATPALTPAATAAVVTPPTTSSDSWVASPGGVQRLRLMFSSRGSTTSTTSSRDQQSQANTTPETPSPSSANGLSPARRSPPDPPGPTPLGGGLGVHYPHLQCPPTFQPETYTLTRAVPSTPSAPSPADETAHKHSHTHHHYHR